MKGHFPLDDGEARNHGPRHDRRATDILECPKMTELSPAQAPSVESDIADATTTTPAAAAPKAPQRSPRHAVARTLADWRPDDNVTMIFQDLELTHPFVCRNYSRIGVRAQLSLFMLQRVLPSNPATLAMGQEFNKAFDARMAEVEALIEEDNKVLLTAAREYGIRTIPQTQSTKPVVASVPIFSPGMGAFIKMFRKIDTLLSSAEYLWLNSVIPTEHQQQLINKYRDQLWGEVRFLQSAWVQARRALRIAQGRQESGNEQANATSASADEGIDAETELAMA